MRRKIVILISCLTMGVLTGCENENINQFLIDTGFVQEKEAPLNGTEVDRNSVAIDILSEGIEDLDETIWFYTTDSFTNDDAISAITRKLQQTKKTYDYCNIKGCSITSTQRQDGYLQTEINLKYYMSKDQYQDVETEIKELAQTLKKENDIASYISIYEWICNNVEYDYDTANGDADRFSAYDALIGKKAVCYGYAALYQRLCDELGLNCIVLTSLDNTAHAWNAVQINDKYYHVDCTFGSNNGEIDWSYCLCGCDRITYGSAYGVKLALKSYDITEYIPALQEEKRIEEEIKNENFEPDWTEIPISISKK